MIDPWTLYWVLKLDVIQEVFLTLSIVCLVLSFLSLFTISFIYLLEDGECVFGKNACRRTMRISIAACAFFLTTTILSTLIPNTKQMATILILPEIATQENIDAFTGEAKEIYGIAKKYLIEITEEQELKNETK